MEESLAVNRELLVFRPPGHPDRAGPVDKSRIFPGQLIRKHGGNTSARRGNSESMQCSREAVTLRPPGHPSRYVLLSNLSDSLSRRSRERDSLEDLGLRINRTTPFRTYRSHQFFKKSYERPFRPLRPDVEEFGRGDCVQPRIAHSLPRTSRWSPILIDEPWYLPAKPSRSDRRG